MKSKLRRPGKPHIVWGTHSIGRPQWYFFPVDNAMWSHWDWAANDWCAIRNGGGYR